VDTGKVIALSATLSNVADPSSVGSISWQTSDNHIATVDNQGQVKGISPGAATITASVASASAKAKVVVTASNTPATPTPPDTAVKPSPVTVTPPELPRVAVDVAMPAVTGQSIVVNAGGDLQAALNAAQPGDEIVVQAGATFSGPYTLPAKTGNGWIIVRSSGTLPAAGTRVGPGNAAQMPKLVSQYASEPVIHTAPGAHHYRLIGLEITANAGVTGPGGLVNLGDGSGAQKTVDQMPHDLVLDRVYVHGTPTLSFQRCVALNSGATAVVDSYLSECHAKGMDSQAIGGWAGSGPYRIENNYLEASGENLMFGGADPSIPNMLPRDIVIRHNHFYKPAAWKGVWSVKNLLELKIGQRVLIEGNVFENCWADAQVGFALLFKSVNQSGSAPWSQTSDVTVRNNRVRNSAHGVSMDAHPEVNPVVPAARIAFVNNVFEKIGDGDYPGGRMWQISGIQGLTIQHNTGFSTGFNGFIFYGGKAAGVVITDNMFGSGTNYLASADGLGIGTDALNAHAEAGWIFRRNVFVGARISAYPTDNFYPAAVADLGLSATLGLPAGSTYLTSATDGGALGANISAINAAVAGVVH
jgi:hypothetical protein